MGFISVAYPALLWGLCLVTVPVLVHWLLKPAPRRLRFPALGLMRGVFTTGQRANRLRNVLLMVLRALVLALVVLCLAGPTCIPTGAGVAANGPLACVAVLDDSLSSRYRPRYEQTDTHLDESRGAAVELAESVREWPPGSELAVVRARSGHESAALTGNPVEALSILRDRTRDVLHAQPLGRALETAGRLLRAARQPRRRVVVFTDGAASAWRDVQPGALAGIDNLDIRVVTPSVETRCDLAIIAATPPTHTWPASAAVPIHAVLRSVGLDSECWLVAREGTRVVARVGPLRVSADSQREVTVSLPPSSPGPHAVTLALEPEDLLAPDQERHVAWQSVPQPLVWLLAPRGARPETDLTLLLLSNLLAPELLSPEEQRVKLQRIDPIEIAACAQAWSAEGGASSKPREPTMIVALPGAGVASAPRDAVLRLIESGVVLVLVPSSGALRVDWPGLRSLLSESSPQVESLPAATAIRWAATAPGTTSTDDLDELTRCAVQRRVRLTGLLDGVRVEARYGDDVPAIVSRKLGRGRIVALTTSPDPAWSDLGVRAAGLLTWLHGLVEEALGPPTAVGQFTAGEVVQTPLPALPEAGLVRVALLGDSRREPIWVRLRGGRPRQPWPTEVPGVYTVRAAGGAARAQFVVNWPAEEFDLTPIRQPGLVRALGTERVRLEHKGMPNTEQEPSRLVRMLRFATPARMLGLALLVLFVTEMAVAARPSMPAATAEEAA